MPHSRSRWLALPSITVKQPQQTRLRSLVVGKRVRWQSSSLAMHSPSLQHSKHSCHRFSPRSAGAFALFASLPSCLSICTTPNCIDYPQAPTKDTKTLSFRPMSSQTPEKNTLSPNKAHRLLVVLCIEETTYGWPEGSLGSHLQKKKIGLKDNQYRDHLSNQLLRDILSLKCSRTVDGKYLDAFKKASTSSQQVSSKQWLAMLTATPRFLHSGQHKALLRRYE